MCICVVHVIPLILVPVLLEGASTSKDVVQGDKDGQGLPNVLKHSLHQIVSVLMQDLLHHSLVHRVSYSEYPKGNSPVSGFH